MVKYFSQRGGTAFCIVAGVVKWLTRRIVAPLRVGSNPTTRPIFLFAGVSPSGKATDFDSVIRWFDSTYPCQKNKAEAKESFGFFVAIPSSYGVS
jgi:hypothetical protein